VLALFLVLPRPGYAQATATISGTVKDSSGAVVPGAKVTATNEDTNLSRSVLADDAGQYVIPLLPLGAYRVRVEKDGFAPFVQNGISLQANTTVQVDAVAQVRANAEQVTVSDRPTLVQANSTAMVQVIDTKRVADLPLNGRNVLQLLSLNAGVEDQNVPVTYQGVNLGGISSANLYLNTVAINGARGSATNYLLDNADNNEDQTSLARPFPNVDAVQEFSIQTSSFDAEYGRGVGGVVNVVTKSGTNGFHGTAFEFLRNYELNAANFFSGRDALKRNQFGGAGGGPVRTDRTFFFASYQSTRIRSATPGAVRTAPSAAMANGDFAEWLKAGGVGVVRDPSAPNQPFPSNVIPQTRFDPIAAKLLTFIPRSSSANYQIRFGTPTSVTNDDQFVVRGDHSFSSRHRMSARHFLLHYDNPPVMAPGNLLYTADGQRGYSNSTAVNDTFIFSPKWVNSATVSYTTAKPDRVVASDTPVSLQQLGAQVKNVPGINLLDVTISGWSGITMGNAAANYTRSFEFTDTIGYATGRHNVRFGGNFRRYRTGFNTFFLTGGTAGFTGQFSSDPGRQNSGNSYAEFLLGDMASWRQLSTGHLNAVNNIFSLFVQDDFRLTSRLTLNLGMRYDPKLGLGEQGHQLGTFVAGQQSTVFPNAPRGMIFYGDKGIEDGVIKSYWKSFAPRVGVAYQITPVTVVRSAYGIFYDEYFGLMLNRTISSQPFVSDATLTGPLQLSSPYAGGPVVDPVNYKVDSTSAIRDFGTYTMPAPRMRPGYTQNWNFVLEREVRANLLVRGAYVGSKGTDLLNTTEINAAVYGPGANASNVNARRIYPRIGPLQLGFPNGNSSYNALQATVQQRYSHGLSLLANYTWSKSLDYSSFGSIESNQTGPDPLNTRNNRGRSNFDVKQRLVISGIWEMPRLTRSNLWVRKILGGWQNNAIFTTQTGIPLTIVSGVDNDFNNVSGDFADYRGGNPQVGGSRSKQQQIGQWFNTSVYAINTVGTIGSSRRGQLSAPGMWNVDYSLFKSFDVVERVQLQLRGEFFNLFNHANLSAPATTFNSPTFGVISSASSPRIAQVAAKLIF
jgi:outer membrane receptor protein involved in Fe transport